MTKESRPITHRLTTLIKPIQNPLFRRPILTQKPTLHQPPEIKHPTRSHRIPTRIRLARPALRVPRIPTRLVRSIKRRVPRLLQLARRAVDRVRGGDAEGVAVGRYAQNNLRAREGGGGPGGEGAHGGTLLVGGGGTGVVEGCVGTDAEGGGPGAPDVVVHDCGVVEHFGEFGDVFHRLTGGVEERLVGDRGREDVGLRGGILAELLEHEEEVRRVVRVDGVASYALFVRELPAEIRGLSDENSMKMVSTYSNSMPCTAKLFAIAPTALMKSLRLSFWARRRENRFEPVQPPTVIITFVLCTCFRF